MLHNKITRRQPLRQGGSGLAAYAAVSTMGAHLLADAETGTGAKIPMLFDTNIGGDIDDALALLYLLGQPRCELVGITTVSGEVVDRGKLVDAVCRAVGRRDIPVHAGTPKPLL